MSYPFHQYGARLFQTAQPGIYHDEQNRFYFWNAQQNIFQQIIPAQQQFLPTASQYSAPPMSAPATAAQQQYIPAATSQQSAPIPRLQQPRPPQDIMICFQDGNHYCSFFGVVDTTYDPSRPPSETNPLNGTGTLRYFSDEKRQIALLDQKQENREIKNFIPQEPININEFSEELTNQIIDEKIHSQAEIIVNQCIAEEREERQRSINELSEMLMNDMMDEEMPLQVAALANEFFVESQTLIAAVAEVASSSKSVVENHEIPSVVIDGLGTFTGELDTKGKPKKGTIIFSKGDFDKTPVKIEFTLLKITVENLVINKTKSGGPTLNYSGTIDAQGYPEGEGEIKVHWEATASNDPNDYRISGDFSGETIINKKNSYRIHYTEQDSRSDYSGSLKNFKPDIKKQKMEEVYKPELLAAQISTTTVSASQPSQLTTLQASSKAVVAPPKDSFQSMAAARQNQKDDDEEEVDGFASVGVTYLVGGGEGDQQNQDILLCWHDELAARENSLIFYSASQKRESAIQQLANLASQKKGRAVMVSRPQELQSLQWQFIGSYLRLISLEPPTWNNITDKLVRLVGFTPTTKVTSLPVLGRVRQVEVAAQPQLEFCLPGLEELPPAVIDIRKKLLAHLGLEDSLALVPLSMQQGHTVQMIDEKKQIGECFFRCKADVSNGEDYYFLGQGKLFEIVENT